MATPRYPFRAQPRKASAGAANEDVAFGPILEPRRYRITHMAARDATTTPTGAITVLVTGPAREHLLDETPAPAAGRLYVYPDDIRLFPGETLIVRFAGSTAADLLEVYIEGDWWEQTEPGESPAEE